jgi:hypothetical protein
MSIGKGLLLAVGLAIATAAPAFAADGGLDDGMAWVINPGGKYTSGKLSTKGMTEVMKTAKPLGAGVIVFMHQGKLYMADDPKGTLYEMRRDMMMSGT